MRPFVLDIQTVPEQERQFYRRDPDRGYLLDDELASLVADKEREIAQMQRERDDALKLTLKLLTERDLTKALRPRYGDPAKLAKVRGELLRDFQWPQFRLVEVDGTQAVRTDDGRDVESVVQQLLGGPDIIIGPWPKKAVGNPFVRPFDLSAQHALICSDPQAARLLARAAGVSEVDIWW